tara:strand:+ start:3698 stop:4348 length:651 start_codon:yes stop_codon:yes gene_type:complete
MRFLISSIFIFIAFLGNSQDSVPFENEVALIQKKYDTLWNPSNETVLFTGSSSIRIWKDLQDRFPEHQIVNTGFGGSQAKDLLAYTDELITRFNPYKIFIYEGDNDIASGTKIRAIMKTMTQIINKIKVNNPKTQIIIISTKPSLSRWFLKRNYKRLNRKFKKLCKKDEQLRYADIWNPMLNSKKLIPDLFIEDGLHMNPKGYEIWYSTLKPFVDQ